MNGNKRALAFQVDEEFFAEVQDYIKAKRMRLKDFGIEAMRHMMAEAPGDNPDKLATPEQE